MASKAQELQVGDRVKVIGRRHPWAGETGRVITAPRFVSILGNPPKLWLEVELEDGVASFGAQPHEVQKLS